MKFSYKARTKEGELQIGNVDAASKEAAANILLSHGLFILSVEPMKGSNFFESFSSFFERVRTTDLMIFTRQFATLLASQVPVGDSLRNLYSQTTRPTLKQVISELATDIQSGFSLSQALGRHPSVFSEFYVNMVKSAEVTGRLGEVLDFLADYLENQSRLIGKVRNALIYPIFVIVLFIGVVIVMLTMVMPQILPIFEESKVELPFITKVMIASGNFFTNWWWALSVISVALLFVLINYIQTEEGKAVKDEVLLRIPIFGKLFQKMYIARFSESSRVLIQGGLTIPQAVEISSHTIGNSVYREELHTAAENVRKGVLLSQALKESSYFPPLVSQLIAVGETTGRLEQLLKKISDFYAREVDDVVSNLVELIQPILLVVIGVMVGGLFASILLPLYSLTKGF